MTTKTKITLQDTLSREAMGGSLGPRVHLEGSSILKGWYHGNLRTMSSMPHEAGHKE